ncbi:uncharacterized protein SPAPADRAFT_58515 [Spathaspora passalidarum NRRL Y-27907]|uniref:SCP domain-containing protein n=1 Tax=Spathaspora passalidarum (strain NRRL Y-27907 / 11-Y1) TaxID=619300 RepID=G3AGF6_SPAPN|nr:uncharacterized protein SPAPADRAFT_58515 [Spathaspora passalidarum NRRL Y-27907]EGW35295.1 hypothetical protein SPAPADRAFT_58515 [Spathaspora passalidarum NRRL Y-27907]
MKFSKIASIALLSAIASSEALTTTSTKTFTVCSSTTTVYVTVDGPCCLPDPSGTEAPITRGTTGTRSDDEPATQGTTDAPSGNEPATSDITDAPSGNEPATSGTTDAPSDNTSQDPTTLTTEALPTTEEPGSPTSSGDAEPSTVDPELSEFAKEILDAQNHKRSRHGAPPLSWNQDVYKFAQKVADSYVCGNNLVHTENNPYGENLGLGYASGTDVVDAWYSEGDNYDYETRTELNHFTALIWKSTTDVGCAYKNCTDLNPGTSREWGLYIVCNYEPAGNVNSEDARKDNILPPTKR